MQEDLLKIKPVIEEVLLREQPESVLEISGYDGCFAKLMDECLEQNHSKKKPNRAIRTDRIDLMDSGLPEDKHRYDNIYKSDCLNTNYKLKEYDIIVVIHLFENLQADDAKLMLSDLLSKAKMSVLVFTPLYPYDLESESGMSTIRAYHPVMFIGYEFSYILAGETNEIQVYNFFPKVDYERLQCDNLTKPKTDIRKMKIAFLLPNLELTGCVKAILQQMKELKKNGHTVTLYYRSDTCKRVIPPWSNMTDDDVSAQVIIPENASYDDYFKDEDVLILGFVNQAEDFREPKTLVVLWEQGSPGIFGDHGKLLTSRSRERKVMHFLYRIPVNILSVSLAITDVLRGVFNRGSQLYINGIDTDFYHPDAQKNNEIPVILLVGNPALKFKGFFFAMDVLEEASKFGIPFKVKWISQIEFKLKNASFEIEKYISPSQEKLAEVYRSADIFLSTSLYESYSLPPLEAMASGLAVISTDNGGINTYAEPGNNCLICEQGDLNSMCFALCNLLLNREARESLAKAGRETALKYSIASVAPQLEKCLSRIIKSYRKP